MALFRFYYVFILLTLLSAACTNFQEPVDANGSDGLKLWYDKPAEDWMTEALPIGNGYMGAMFFGKPGEEHIQFSEESLWSGGPSSHPAYNYGNRKDAYQYLPKIRSLLKEGKMEAAHKLASRELTGEIHQNKESDLSFGDFGAQQTMGDLYVKVAYQGEVKNYQRSLDLSSAVGEVTYQAGEVRHQRQFFGSYPRRAFVYRFSNTAPEGITYAVRFETPYLKIKEGFDDNTYSFEGKLEDNGLLFETCFKVMTDGKATYENGMVKIKGARTMTLIHTAATAYRMQYPDYAGNNYRSQNDRVMEGAGNKSFDELLAEHVQDYRHLFDRVSLSLGGGERDSLPVNERLVKYQQELNDPGLEALYFQYGRYLMISASRPGTMPLHLQGKWNRSTNPPWACDYHMNINLQMLYWPAEVTNLRECHLPLFSYIESLVEPGQRSAKAFFNTRGWVVNTMNNAYGYTAPGWGFPWGFFPGGAAWLSQHLWEHYAFTGDTIFLREQAFPVMKGAALFWMDYLTEGENGYLISSPSYSPEHGGISRGASMDHQIAWDVLNNCIAAAKILGKEEEFKKEAIVVRDKILPPEIGRWGQLQEWKEDVDDPENHHRHVSHLFALYPGRQISMAETPALAEAARVSLNARGDGGTGWSLAWKVALWARLQDGNRSYTLFQRLLRPVGDKEVDMMDGGGTYANLLCAHPPFQLDGNMGSTTAIAEMLLQSHTGKLALLPALPDAWQQGAVRGLRARGGFTVDIAWQDGQLKEAVIVADQEGGCNVSYQGKTVEISLNKDERYVLKNGDFTF